MRPILFPFFFSSPVRFVERSMAIAFFPPVTQADNQSGRLFSPSVFGHETKPFLETLPSTTNPMNFSLFFPSPAMSRRTVACGPTFSSFPLTSLRCGQGTDAIHPSFSPFFCRRQEDQLWRPFFLLLPRRVFNSGSRCSVSRSYGSISKVDTSSPFHPSFFPKDRAGQVN